MLLFVLQILSSYKIFYHILYLTAKEKIPKKREGKRSIATEK